MCHVYAYVGSGGVGGEMRGGGRGSSYRFNGPSAAALGPVTGLCLSATLDWVPLTLNCQAVERLAAPPSHALQLHPINLLSLDIVAKSFIIGGQGAGVSAFFFPASLA